MPPVAAERVDAASTIALLEKLKASNPGNKRIHVIADNARHHGPAQRTVASGWSSCPPMRREVAHNTFHAGFALFAGTIFDFFRR